LGSGVWDRERVKPDPSGDDRLCLVLRVAMPQRRACGFSDGVLTNMTCNATSPFTLLGEDLLPTAVVPLTSIATRIFYGPRVAACVRFLDGRTQEIPVGDLYLYTTEKGNPRNVKGVALAEVEFPGEALRDGTMLTDTPGIGSVFEHNTKAAVEYIPQADAAIFLVNADPPISEAERDFLTSVRPHL